MRILVTVDAEAEVEESSGHAILDEAALKAARKQTFTAGEKPMAYRYQIRLQLTGRF